MVRRFGPARPPRGQARAECRLASTPRTAVDTRRAPATECRLASTPRTAVDTRRARRARGNTETLRHPPTPSMPPLTVSATHPRPRPAPPSQPRPAQPLSARTACSILSSSGSRPRGRRRRRSTARRGSVRPATMSTHVSNVDRRRRSGDGCVPADATASPRSGTEMCHGCTSSNSHCSVSAPSPWSGLTVRRRVSKSSAWVSSSRDGGPTFSPKTPARTSFMPRWDCSSGVRPSGSGGGPGRSSSAKPAERILVESELTPSTPISSKVKPQVVR